MTNAEMAVLGSMIIDRRASEEAMSVISAEDFSNEQYRTIYSAINDMVVANRMYDVLILKEHIKKKGDLDKVGGVEFLVELAEFVPSSKCAMEYAREVREESLKRKNNMGKEIEDGERCELCKRWHQRGVFDLGGKGEHFLGECRTLPPVVTSHGVVYDKDGNFIAEMSTFPLTNTDTWCGHYEPKE